MTKKVDFVMEIFHKIISVVTVLACVAGLAWSCTNDGIVARADDITDVGNAIATFERSFREALVAVNEDVAEAVNDSNIPLSTKQNILKTLAMQNLMLRTMGNIYGFPEDPILPDSDEVTFSGSGFGGFYQYNNIIYPCTVYNPYYGGIIIDSDLVHWSSNYSGYTFTNQTNYSYISGYQALRCQALCSSAPSNKAFSVTWSSSVIPSQSFSYSFSSGSVNYCWIGYSPNSIPTLSPYYYQSDYAKLTGSGRPWDDTARALFGSGSAFTMPDASVDTDTPWDYYNDYLLPYFQQNYPDVTNNYYVFPNGYLPQQDPTEPPLPDGNNGGITVNNNWNFNIGINNIVVTDASGQPVTDASGETVTETVIETETRPTDAVYHFQIPTLTPLETQVATIPPYEVPVEYAGYMSDAFTAIADFIDDAGLSSIAPVFLALAGIGLVIGVLL